MLNAIKKIPSERLGFFSSVVIAIYPELIIKLLSNRHLVFNVLS